MILRLCAGMLAALSMLAAPTLAFAQDDLPGRVGRIADVGGEVFLAPQDKPDQWAPIGLNYPVANGDNLWVGNDGRAEVDFGPGQFRLGSGSNVHLSRLDDRQFALFVAQGIAQVRIRFLEPGDSARIDTPNTQIVLTRPGSYRVDVSEDREHTMLVVREGEANVLTSAAVQQVLPGQTATIDGTDPRYANVVNGIGNDPFDTWAASRDRYYQRGGSTNHVSPQMVGAADLDQYGTWTQQPEYGAVWYPSNVGPDWAPYRDGYWTDVGAYGPTWVDAAPWGYAPFHYGRWAHIGGRWGWTPGVYVARPLWAPALVGWAGGAGWSISVSSGGPVYGWVPLAWGEPYRPWWGRCSQGCWDRYNRPYAVNTAVVRQNSPPPARYVNWNQPGGISAMSGSAMAARKPVSANLVRVPGGMAASAPVLATAPRVRSEPNDVFVRRPGQGVPPPASTFSPTLSRPSSAPGGMGSATNAPGNQMMRPDTRVTPAPPPPAQGSLSRQSPAPTPPPPAQGSLSRQSPTMNAPAPSQQQPGGFGAATSNPPSRATLQPTPQQVPQANAQPTPAARPVTPPGNSGRSMGQQPTAPPAQPGNAPSGFAQPSNVQPQPQQPNSLSRQQRQVQPAPQPMAQPTPVSPSVRAVPQPASPMAAQPHAAPAPSPSPRAVQPSPPPAPQGNQDSTKREGHGGGNQPGQPDSNNNNRQR